MMLRRFGSRILAVAPRFDARALTEIGFTKTGEIELGAEAFEVGWECVSTHELAPTAEGDVQDEAEQELLAKLEAELLDLVSAAGSDEHVLIENQVGVDHPKTRDRKKPVIVDGENRLYFEWRVEPPLRVGVYRPRG